MPAMRILGVSGSLRRGSHNTSLLRAAAQSLPSGVELVELDPAILKAVPAYDQDDDHDEVGSEVRALREAIAGADAVLFATPEYNGSVPGVLKNAIDVGSRPYGKSSFNGRPMGIVSNSPGPLGGVSAAKHLQNILPGISGPILQQPEIYLNGVGDAFDDKGELTKETLQKVLKQYIDAYAAHVEKHNK